MQNVTDAGHDFVTVGGPTLRHASPMLDITSRSTHPAKLFVQLGQNMPLRLGNLCLR